MRRACVLLLALGCAEARPRPRAVSHNALRGVEIALPPVEDKRPSASTGCGHFAPDLPQRTEKALYVALGDAGAQVDRRGFWTLTVRLLYGGAAEEYTGSQKAPPGPDESVRTDFGPSLSETRGGINGGWSDTSVSLEGLLSREGQVVWHGTAGGHARSAPCVNFREKLEEALAGAVGDLRDRVVKEIDRAGPPAQR